MAPRSRLPFPAEAVQPWWSGERGGRGALLLHGFAGTPPELRGLGERLAAEGWRCHGPLLAGHGTTPEDLERTTWRDWAESARRALDALAAECTEVVVAGQSMGGAMALHLAATGARVTAVATLAAPVWLSDWRLRILPVARHVVRWHEPDPDDIDLYDRAAVDRLWSYGRRATRSLVELNRFVATVRSELPLVRQPVLVLHGERDRSVDPRNAEDIARGLTCSREVVRHVYPRSGHALSVDVDHADAEERIARWFDRWVPAGGASAAG